MTEQPTPRRQVAAEVTRGMGAEQLREVVLHLTGALDAADAYIATLLGLVATSDSLVRRVESFAKTQHEANFVASRCLAHGQFDLARQHLDECAALAFPEISLPALPPPPAGNPMER